MVFERRFRAYGRFMRSKVFAKLPVDKPGSVLRAWCWLVTVPNDRCVYCMLPLSPEYQSSRVLATVCVLCYHTSSSKKGGKAVDDGPIFLKVVDIDFQPSQRSVSHGCDGAVGVVNSQRALCAIGNRERVRVRCVVDWFPVRFLCIALYEGRFCPCEGLVANNICLHRWRERTREKHTHACTYMHIFFRPVREPFSQPQAT